MNTPTAPLTKYTPSLLVDSDLHISVPNPENAHDAPIFDGALKDAAQTLTPGVYLAYADYDDETVDGLLYVTETGATFTGENYRYETLSLDARYPDAPRPTLEWETESGTFTAQLASPYLATVQVRHRANGEWWTASAFVELLNEPLTVTLIDVDSIPDADQARETLRDGTEAVREAPEFEDARKQARLLRETVDMLDERNMNPDMY